MKTEQIQFIQRAKRCPRKLKKQLKKIPSNVPFFVNEFESQRNAIDGELLDKFFVGILNWW